MKELIQEVKFTKEGENKFGKYYTFIVKYDGKQAYYNSKSKDQKKFIAGQEAEFTEEEKTYTNKQGNPGSYFIVKPIPFNKQSNFGKTLKKEQARYSGFAVSYAKDLVVAGKIEFTELSAEAWILFEMMVEMDKSLES